MERTPAPAKASDAKHTYHKNGFDPFPRLTDWSLALAVGLAFVTGVISLVSGRPGDWLIFALHGALGLWIVVLLWGKFRRTLPRLVRPRLWDRRMLIGVAVTALVGLTLASGVWWVFAGDLPLTQDRALARRKPLWLEPMRRGACGCSQKSSLIAVYPLLC